MNLDDTILQWLHSRNTPLGIQVFEAITFLGSPIFLYTLGTIVALWLARMRRWSVLLGWCAALAGGLVIESGLKLLIQRPRPPYAAPYLHTFTYSFPSGHAMNSLITYGMLATILVTTIERLERRPHSVMKTGVFTCTALLVLGIGFSRLYLGVHYFSDVVAGFAAGMLWLFVCLKWTYLPPAAGAVPVSEKTFAP